MERYKEVILLIVFCLACGGCASARDIAGTVERVTDRFLLLETGDGPEVVHTDEWTVYGNMASRGSLKYGGDRVTTRIGRRQAGVAHALSVEKEPEYAPDTARVAGLEQLAAELDKGTVLLVDARDAGERVSGYIPVSLPFTSAADIAKLAGHHGAAKRVVLYGSSGGDLRPYSAARALAAAGLSEVVVFREGLHGWRRAGKPVYASPEHLARLIEKGIAFRLIDLRTQPDSRPLLDGAERVTAAALTRDSAFLPHRSYQMPLFLYGSEADCRAAAVTLAGWNYQGDGEFTILDPAAGWPDTLRTARYTAGRLPANEIDIHEFRALWERGDPAKVILNVKPKRDRDSAREQHIPLDELPDRLGELPRDREIIVYCRVGISSLIAWQILRENGFTARFINRTIMVDGNGQIKADAGAAGSR